MRILTTILLLAACGKNITEREIPITYERGHLPYSQDVTLYENQFAYAIHDGLDHYYYTGTFQMISGDTGKVYIDIGSGPAHGVDIGTAANCEFTTAGTTLTFSCDGIPAQLFEHVPTKG